MLDSKSQMQLLNQKLVDLEADLARKNQDNAELSREKDQLVKEMREKNDSMTE